MGIELVTGFTGKAHISSLDVAKFNAGAFGPGEYVFAGVKDDKLKATMASSNKVHISSGNAMMQGRHFWVDAAGVDLTVQTGTQGQKRNDLVVARYAKNASTGIESVSLVVIKGTPTTGTPADPSYTRGDILNGNALANDMPLWRIPLNGITVGTPVQLFKEFTSAKDAWDSVSHKMLIHEVGYLEIVTSTTSPVSLRVQFSVPEPKVCDVFLIPTGDSFDVGAYVESQDGDGFTVKADKRTDSWGHHYHWIAVSWVV